MPLPVSVHEHVGAQESPHDEHWAMRPRRGYHPGTDVGRDGVQRTGGQHVREEREAEEDDREDEVAKATDGVGSITADYEWKEVGV